MQRKSAVQRATALILTLVAAGLMTLPSARAADFPKPSPYPIAWEFDFKHSMPKRIVVNTATGSQAYYYMTYTVTNNTREERMFFPYFVMLTDDGRLIRSDRNVPEPVFTAIKNREGNRFLEPEWKIESTIRIGEDQARDGVAIWPQPMARMGQFSIFIGGLSGETATVKGPDDKETILRKTLQLSYIVRGDETYPDQAQISEVSSQWVMR